MEKKVVIYEEFNMARSLQHLKEPRNFHYFLNMDFGKDYKVKNKIWIYTNEIQLSHYL